MSGMAFCDRHWKMLRTAIEQRGLAHLVASDGSLAQQQFADQIRTGEVSATNFDPLMGAHWAIVNNVLEQVGVEALSYLASAGPEDPVDAGHYGKRYRGRCWPRCPLCYINLGHEMTCRGCQLDKRGGFDWMIERAAEDQVQRARELGVHPDEQVH